jgi:hypothetical protein
VRVGWQVDGPDDIPRTLFQVGGFTAALAPDQAVGLLLDLATAIGVAAPGHAAGVGVGEAVEVLLSHGREFVGA